MLVLGVHGGLPPRTTDSSHRASLNEYSCAALLRDGELLAAVTEERLTGVRAAGEFPTHAVRYCLQEAGTSCGELDAVAIDASEPEVDAICLQRAMADPRAPFINGRGWVAGLFRDAFAAEVSQKLHFCDTARAHAHASWLAAGCGEALCLCLEGTGGVSAGGGFHFGEHGTRAILNFQGSQSLQRLIDFAGDLLHLDGEALLRRGDLALAGDPGVYESLFARMYQLRPDGQFALGSEAEQLDILRRMSHEVPRRREVSGNTSFRRNVVAALRTALCRVIQHVLTYCRAQAPTRRLCLSGSVATDPVLAGAVLQLGWFAEVHAAADGASCIGAAAHAARELGMPYKEEARPPGSHLGPDIASERIGAQLQRWSPAVSSRQVTDISARAAQLIGTGKRVAWLQGRAELGPLPLGNRVILADCRRIGAQPWYAPERILGVCVLGEHLQSYFEMAADANPGAYLTICLPMRPQFRELLRATALDDGTVPVYRVVARENAALHDLIEKVRQLTGLPMVASLTPPTSPIRPIEFVNEAVGHLLLEHVDHLALGDWLVDPANDCAPESLIGSLGMTLRAGCRAVRRITDHGEVTYALESAGQANGPGVLDLIPKHTFDAVTGDSDSFLQHCHRSGIRKQELLESMFQDVIRLWRSGLITMTPAQ